MQPKYALTSLFFLFVSIYTSNAQQKLDSLLRELNNHRTEDTVRFKLLIATGVAYQRNNPDKGIEISDSAITLAKNLHLPVKVADAYNTKAGNYFFKADYPEALKWFQQALEVYQQEGIKKGVANSYNNIGNLHTLWGNYSKALDYYESALKTYRELNLKNYELLPLSNMSRIYLNMSNLPKALEYAQKSLGIAESIHDSSSLSTCYNNIGDIHSQLAEFNSAISYYEKGYDISLRQNNKIGQAMALQKIGKGFLAMSDYDKALDYQKRSLKIGEQSGFKDIRLYGAVSLGDIYTRLHDYGNAMKYYEEALPMATTQGNKRIESAIKMKMGESLLHAPDSVLLTYNIQASERYNRASDLISQAVKIGKEINNLELQQDAYGTLAELDSAKNDYVKALDDYKNYIIIRDSILNDTKRKEIEHISMQYEFDKKKDSLGLQQQVTDEKLKQQILLARQQQQQLALNQKELALINKEKDFQKLAFLKTQADFQNSQLEKREKEKQLTLSEKEKQLQLAKVKTLTQERALDAFKQQQQQDENKIKMYALLGVIIVFLLIAFFLLRNNRQKQKTNTVLQKQKEEIQSTLVELKSTQAQLIQSEKMASLGELTAGIAHEIQNPLNFVNNFSEVNTELLEEMEQEIDKGNFNEVKIIAKDLIENEQKIIHHGKRADAIVKGMLQHSRASNGKKEPADVNALADEYLRLSYHGLRAKDKSFNAEIKTDFDEGIGKINIVSQDIGRVVLNLINNAFYAVNVKKKTADENYKPTVMVKTKKLNGKVEIIVSDNGDGIPQNIVDKIFQPFFTTKPTGEGTGLGLSLAYDIITKEHNGTIKAENLNTGNRENGNDGSKFTITLPAY